jgi:uncharacterized protein YndB with AHSA1/START domain
MLRTPLLLAATVLAVTSLGTASPAGAEVASVDPGGFSVKREATVQAQPAAAWTALTASVGSWWNPEHSYSRDAKNLSIEARAGGCFCEKLPDGGGVEHMRVVYVAPGKALRMTGGLGPLQAHGLAGSLTWKLSPVEGGTAVQVVYEVGGRMAGGFEKIAPLVDGVVGEQLARLKSFLETGKPTAP